MHKRSRFTRFIYAASFCFGLQGALVAYANSTYLEKFIPSSLIGVVYGISYALALGALFLAPSFIRKIGNRRFALGLLVLDFLSLLVLANGRTPASVLVAFILYLSTSAAIVYCFDIFIEHINPDAAQTGSIRGLYLTIVNFSWVLAPIITGYLLTQYGFTMLYGISMTMVAATFLFFGAKLRGYKDPPYKSFTIIRELKKILATKKLRNVAAVDFTLQLFYSWMTIFMPLYLILYLGFSWVQVGIIFTIMLVPFVLLQYPLGKIADKYLGEKEMMIAGSVIMGIACLCIPFMQHASLIAWAILLFISRIGAATIEAMTEIYFFKSVGERDVGLLSAYRFTIPFAYMIGPIIGGIIVALFSYNALFAILGVIVLGGVYCALKLRDTK